VGDPTTLWHNTATGVAGYSRPLTTNSEFIVKIPGSGRALRSAWDWSAHSLFEDLHFVVRFGGSDGLL
jgi:hypothetical protein